MITVAREVTVPATAEAFYQIITDYPGYVCYTRQVIRVELMNQLEHTATVRFHAKFIRKFSYVLRLTGSPSRQLDWIQLEGPFKSNAGTWQLAAQHQQTSCWTYRNELDPGFFVPSFAINALLGPDLDYMIEAMSAAAADRLQQ